MSNIKAKNLRIGNILSDPEGGYVEVIRLNNTGLFEVHSVDFQFYDLHEDNNDMFSGVQLTIPLLIDLGFKGQYLSSYVSYGKIEIQEQDGYFYYDLFRSQNVKFQYLHELQNLLYCLIGKELPVEGLVKFPK